VDKGGVAGAGLDEDMLGLIVFQVDMSDPDGRLAMWSEDDERPYAWDGVTCDARTCVSALSLAGLIALHVQWLLAYSSSLLSKHPHHSLA
jgi:hypothetical protein